jgi:transposase-like protein
VRTRLLQHASQPSCTVYLLKKRVIDEELETWRTRTLDQIEYLILDARYEKVRVAGSVRDCAVLIAIQPGRHRSVLGVSVSLSEAEVHWREFLVSLKQRGLHGVKLIVSDAHEGRERTVKCILHLALCLSITHRIALAVAGKMTLSM